MPARAAGSSQLPVHPSTTWVSCWIISVVRPYCFGRARKWSARSWANWLTWKLGFGFVRNIPCNIRRPALESESRDRAYWQVSSSGSLAILTAIKLGAAFAQTDALRLECMGWPDRYKSGSSNDERWTEEPPHGAD
jgi:hypothetical protein